MIAHNNKGLLRWLFADGAVLLFFFCLRTSRTLTDRFVFRVTLPFEQALGRFCACVPFSAAGVFYVLLVLDVLACLVLAVRYVVHAAHRGRAFVRCILFFADLALTFYAAFCLLWGANYAASDFCDRAALYPEPVACDDLVALTQHFADKLAACADQVPRDEAGLFCADRAAILSAAPAVYETLYGEFPFLDTQSLTPKPFFLSKIMSYMDFTGFYFPFTGEANLNVDSPVSALPVTALHEMTHQRGIASEQQCNFVAILAAVRSDDAAYRYSGYYQGYIYLSNALYRTDYDAWRSIRETLPEPVRLDLAYTNAYWAQFEGPAATASQKLNDSMIRSYGDPLGVQSYGAVVDLLVQYYK